MSTRWKKRWFRLEMRSLRYFNMMNSEPLGSIPLLCSNVSTAEINKESVVVIEGSERTYYLLRESTDEMRKVSTVLLSVRAPAYWSFRNAAVSVAQRGLLRVFNSIPLQECNPC
jgi:hypothetical protein